MAERPPPRRRPEVTKTGEFRRWSQSLDQDRKAKLTGTIARIVQFGPTLGRPHVDVIHGSRVHRLKEARIDRGTRVLFAFDSNRNAVMLVGGDKTGKWNRWYPKKIQQAERLYLDHERTIGKGSRCLSQDGARTTQPQRSL
jgi:hypothetical protein